MVTCDIQTTFFFWLDFLFFFVVRFSVFFFVRFCVFFLFSSFFPPPPLPYHLCDFVVSSIATVDYRDVAPPSSLFFLWDICRSWPRLCLTTTGRTSGAADDNNDKKRLHANRNNRIAERTAPPGRCFEPQAEREDKKVKVTKPRRDGQRL